MRVCLSNNMPKITAEANVNWSDEWTDEEMKRYAEALEEGETVTDKIEQHLDEFFKSQIPEDELETFEITVSVTE